MSSSRMPEKRDSLNQPSPIDNQSEYERKRDALFMSGIRQMFAEYEREDQSLEEDPFMSRNRQMVAENEREEQSLEEEMKNINLNPKTLSPTRMIGKRGSLHPPSHPMKMKHHFGNPFIMVPASTQSEDDRETYDPFSVFDGVFKEMAARTKRYEEMMKNHGPDNPPRIGFMMDTNKKLVVKEGESVFEASYRSILESAKNAIWLDEEQANMVRKHGWNAIRKPRL